MNDIALFDVATLYSKRFGCECFPLVGKLPALDYTWQQNALGKPGVHPATAAHWDGATGYAVAPVAGSTLAILDIDDSTFEKKIREDIPELNRALTVRRGDHAHIYVTLAYALPQAYLTHKIDKQEIASLRGAGAYVAGPYSQHPSGARYTPAPGFHLPVVLDAEQTGKLLAFFQFQPHTPGSEESQAVDLNSIVTIPGNLVSPGLVQQIMGHLLERGYKPHYDAQRQLWWLNGRCPNHAGHEHGDRHPSFGLNSAGVGYCFVCGSMLAVEVADYLDIERRPMPPDAVRRQRDPRVERIAAKQTRAVRLVDILTTTGKRYTDQYIDGRVRTVKLPSAETFTIREILDAGKHVGWSRACTFDVIREAIRAGLVKRVRRGEYRCLEQFQTAAPTLPFGPAYSEHPAEYRRQMLLKVERDIQPEQPTASCMAAATVAWYGGIHERTLYRYENKLKIRRVQVWTRYPLPTITGPNGQRVAYAPTDHLDLQGNGRPTAYRRFEVVHPEYGTIRRVDYGKNPGESLARAQEIAREFGAVVLVAERRPSIRVLPGQHARDRVPDYGKLSFDQRCFVVDPAGLFGAIVPPKPPSLSKTKLPENPPRSQPTALRGGRAVLNDSDHTDRIKTFPMYPHGQPIRADAPTAPRRPQQSQSAVESAHLVRRKRSGVDQC